MATEISPRKVQEAIQRGRKRLQNFRAARLMFIRQYVGQYYDRESGEIGTEALNLIFNAIRALVPHIVMSFPKHNLETPYLQQRQYGDLLGNALSQQDKKLDIKNGYRRAIVDAIFSIGIFKTGLAQSDSIYAMDDGSGVDAGTIYSQPVDFDNLIVDPSSKEHLFRDASFIGDCMTIPRETLLMSGLFKNDLVERLPRASQRSNDERASALSMRNINVDDNHMFEDEVEIAEIWVPAAQALIYVPATDDVQLDDYLRVDDYYGVKEGPYSFLALTPPVPGNPIPVPMVGIWQDLHVLANRMAAKVVDQAMRQKDVIIYKRSSADDAKEMRDAKDGESVACDDPTGVDVKSFGGQQNSNEAHLQQLQLWFNYMAGNPDQMAGAADNSDTATQAKILSTNSNVGLDDMKDLVYAFAAEEARKRAWYLDSDPMMNIPLTRRQMKPAQFVQGPMGPFMASPPTSVEEQVILTPELRCGDFLDFTFTIEPESLGRQDSQTRLAQAMDFAVKLMPAVATAAQTFMALGLPFSAKAFLLRMAKYANIDWLDEVFYDPEFQMQMQMQMMMGPQQQKAQVQGGAGGQGMPGMGGPGLGAPSVMDQILQNGQPAGVQAGMPSPQEQMMSGFQQGAVPAQQQLKRGY